MPGSRVKEVRMNLPTILQAADQIGPEYVFLLPVAPSLDREFLRTCTVGRPVTLVPDALPALHHSRAGIVASGTATIEAAMMGTPFVMVYRVSPLTYLLGKPRIKVPYFAMVNLIAGDNIIPELVQHDFTAANVAAHLREILPEGDARARILAGLAEVRGRLKPTGTDLRSAADRAAEEVLRFLPSGPSVPSLVSASGNPAARIGVQ
jgi:lipid-A-disaccharide synthase